MRVIRALAVAIARGCDSLVLLAATLRVCDAHTTRQVVLARACGAHLSAVCRALRARLGCTMGAAAHVGHTVGTLHMESGMARTTDANCCTMISAILKGGNGTMRTAAHVGHASITFDVMPCMATISSTHFRSVCCTRCAGLSRSIYAGTHIGITRARSTRIDEVKSNVARLALNAFMLVAQGADHGLPIDAVAFVNDAEGSRIEMISAIAAGANGTLI